MKTSSTYSIITLIGVVCLTSLSVQAADNKPVVVNNDAANPVPVTIVDPVVVRTGGVYRYAGLTDEGTLPVIGMNGMNNQCRAEFGEEARMCSTEEFFLTPDTTSYPDGEISWVRSIFTGGFSHDGSERHDEWSGSTVIGSLFGLTCGRYTLSSATSFSSVIYATFDGTQRTIFQTCDSNHVVTCCTPQ